jgi:hypothetical protein
MAGIPMTIEELLARESIRHTMASYTLAGDRLHTEAFVACFTEDGILESEGVPDQDAFHYVGRPAIREWIERWKHPSSNIAGAPRASFVRHHLSTCLIEFSASDTASVRTYWVAYTDIGQDHSGCYIDIFRKIDECWLLAHRRVRLDWRSPNSLFKSVIAETRKG